MFQIILSILDFKTYVKRSLETLKFQMRELTNLVETVAMKTWKELESDTKIPGFHFPLQKVEVVRELEKNPVG